MITSNTKCGYNWLSIPNIELTFSAEWRIIVPQDWGCFTAPLHWRHNECDGVPSHQPHECLLKHLFRCRSKKTSKLRVAGLCEENSPEAGAFPAHRPVTRSFDVFFDMRLNKRLSKQPWGWWFETLSRPLWRHRNVTRIQKQTHYNWNVISEISFEELANNSDTPPTEVIFFDNDLFYSLQAKKS